jgi:peptide deformylase
VAVIPIVEYPDARLRQRAEPVTGFDGDLARLAQDLGDTLRAAGGMALCAPQIGHGRRVVVVAGENRTAEPEIYVNPEILTRSTPGFVEESCLSLPGIVGSVWRATRVTVRARDGSGAVFERRLKGLPAVCLQHEIDHLEGVLFVDRLWLVQRLRVRARLAARERAVARTA